MQSDVLSEFCENNAKYFRSSTYTKNCEGPHSIILALDFLSRLEGDARACLNEKKFPEHAAVLSEAQRLNVDEEFLRLAMKFYLKLQRNIEERWQTAKKRADARKEFNPDGSFFQRIDVSPLPPSPFTQDWISWTLTEGN